jgi:hypothetical protein
MKHVRLGASAEKAGRVLNSQAGPSLTRPQRLVGQKLGRFGLNRACWSILQQAPPGIRGAWMMVCRECTCQGRQIGLDLPVGGQAIARTGVQAIQVGLEVASGPQLVEGGVQVAHQERGAAGLAMMADRLDELFGQQALGFGIAFAAFRLLPSGDGQLGVEYHGCNWQRADRGAGGFVQLGAEPPLAERPAAAVTALGGVAALATGSWDVV